MAQPSGNKLQILGSVAIKKDLTYTAAGLKAEKTFFSPADFFILKTKAPSSAPISVSINDTPGIPIEYNESTAFDNTTPLEYKFNQDCIIAMAQELP